MTEAKITKTSQAFSDVFDVNPTTGEVSPPAVVPEVQAAVEAEKPIETDFDIARTSIHNVLVRSQRTLENAILIADGTEDPESYNAVSKLIEKITEASTRLMTLHDIKQKASPKPVAAPSEPGSSSTTITGPVFVGSTSELAKLISDQRKLESKPKEN